MRKLLTVLMFSAMLAIPVGCSDDDADAPKVDCPNPSYLNGLIQQIQAIQQEINQLQAQLLNATGPDRDAINQKIENATKRGLAIDEELNTYSHCF